MGILPFGARLYIASVTKMFPPPHQADRPREYLVSAYLDNTTLHIKR